MLTAGLQVRVLSPEPSRSQSAFSIQVVVSPSLAATPLRRAQPFLGSLRSPRKGKRVAGAISLSERVFHSGCRVPQLSGYAASPGATFPRLATLTKER